MIYFNLFYYLLLSINTLTQGKNIKFVYRSTLMDTFLIENMYTNNIYNRNNVTIKSKQLTVQTL